MKVLVVGAGPAGVVTALLLARYGVDVKLVERERSFERVFRGEGLMPLGIDALFEMGLEGVLQSVPGRRVDSWDIWIDGEEVFVIPEPVEELGERAMRVVSPLLRLLLLVRARSRRLHSVKVYDFFRVASANRPAKSLRGIHGSVGWCALLCSLMAKVERRETVRKEI